MDRKCINALKELRESERYTKGMFCWIGFKKTFVEFEQGDRLAGESSWNFKSLFSLAIEGIVSYTTAPLRLATFLGIIVSILAFVYLIYVVVKTILYGESVTGFPTLISVSLFLGGIQLFCLGIIGQYLSKTYLETKDRPIYIVKETEERIYIEEVK